MTAAAAEPQGQPATKLTPVELAEFEDYAFRVFLAMIGGLMPATTAPVPDRNRPVMAAPNGQYKIEAGTPPIVIACVQAYGCRPLGFNIGLLETGLVEACVLNSFVIADQFLGYREYCRDKGVLPGTIGPPRGPAPTEEPPADTSNIIVP